MIQGMIKDKEPSKLNLRTLDSQPRKSKRMRKLNLKYANVVVAKEEKKTKMFEKAAQNCHC